MQRVYQPLVSISPHTRVAHSIISHAHTLWLVYIKLQQALLSSKVAFLRSVDCFSQVATAKLSKLAAVMSMARYPVGATIALEGGSVDPLEYLQIVKVGEVQVLKRMVANTHHASLVGGHHGRPRAYSGSVASVATASAALSPAVRLASLPVCDVGPGGVISPLSIVDHGHVKEGPHHMATLVAATVVVIATLAREDFMTRLDHSDHVALRRHLIAPPSEHHTRMLARGGRAWQQYRQTLLHDTLAEVLSRRRGVCVCVAVCVSVSVSVCVCACVCVWLWLWLLVSCGLLVTTEFVREAWLLRGHP